MLYVHTSYKMHYQNFHTVSIVIFSVCVWIFLKKKIEEAFIHFRFVLSKKTIVFPILHFQSKDHFHFITFVFFFCLCLVLLRLLPVKCALEIVVIVAFFPSSLEHTYLMQTRKTDKSAGQREARKKKV